MNALRWTLGCLLALIMGCAKTVAVEEDVGSTNAPGCRTDSDCPVGQICMGKLCIVYNPPPPPDGSPGTDLPGVQDEGGDLPPPCLDKENCGDGLDNDCDGEIDEGCDCLDGEMERCYEGPEGTEGVGACSAGTRSCQEGQWGLCDQQILPMAEICDAKDNDCDGGVDEELSCQSCRLGETRECYGGAEGSEGVGACHGGTQACGPLGWEEECLGEVMPGDEICDGQDNDCDGSVDEGCDCQEGEEMACFEGPASARGVGLCREGKMDCVEGGWGPCEGQVLPVEEVCDDEDNDCDGQRDEDLAGCCREGSTQVCGVSDLDPCAYGQQTCAEGQWGACVGSVDPQNEACDGKDNDCDGLIDEDLPNCCRSGEVQSCGASDVSPCHKGTQVCQEGRWGACVGNKDPTSEVCDGIDNDCDGQIDENIEGCCEAGQARTCGQSDIFPCQKGTQVCEGGQWQACEGFIDPTTEVCDGRDNDCDGQVDENVCANGDTCDQALPLALEDALQGDTAVLSNDYLGGGCNYFQAEGPDVVYQVNLVEGHTYYFHVEPLPGETFDISSYVSGDCGDIENSCLSGMDGSRPGYPERYSLTAMSTGPHYMVVDGAGVTDEGEFTVRVTEIPPLGEDCSDAIPLWIYSSLTGDTSLYRNDLNPLGGSCDGLGLSQPGPDTVYQFFLFPGETYHIDVTPYDWDVGIYIAGDCYNIEGSCFAGTDAGYIGEAESLSVTALAPTMLYIVVDAWKDIQEGYYTLETMLELPTP